MANIFACNFRTNARVNIQLYLFPLRNFLPRRNNIFREGKWDTKTKLTLFIGQFLRPINLN